MTDVASQDLPRSTPAAQGVAAEGIDAFLDALEAVPVELHSMMLLRHGHVVAEGWWDPYTPQRPHLLYSLSKSFTSAALGLAVEEGHVRLDDTVISHFPELDAEVTDPRSRRIRVRDVAAMASGHEDETLDRVLAIDPDDPVRGFLLLPPEREPGTWFAYNQPCTYTLARILVRRTGQGLTDYLRPRLLDPLGIGEVGWHRDAHGVELGFSGLHGTTDAIARLGQLLLQGGTWDGRRLLPAEWVAEATRPHVQTHGQGRPDDWSRGYGFQFWMSRHGFRGDGAYGQLCVVLPEQGAVLATTAATEAMQEVLDAVWDHLVPAMGPVPARPTDDGPTAAERGLAERLDSLRLTGPATASQPPSASADRWRAYRAGRPGAAEGAGRATAPVVEVEVRHEDGAWLADVNLPGEGVHLRVDLSGDAWRLQECAVPDGVLPVASSGGWDGDGGATLRLGLLLVETPHRLEVTCDLEARSATSRWVTEPLGGPPLTHLRAGELRSPRI